MILGKVFRLDDNNLVLLLDACLYLRVWPLWWDETNVSGGFLYLGLVSYLDM